MRIPRLIPALLLMLAATLSGCRFSRVIVNSYVRDFDTSWIRPGVTTREEVIERLGMSPASREGGGVKQDSFRWIMVDTDNTGLEAGYIVTPTFERSKQYIAEDILICFDKDNKVSLLSRTRRKDGVLRLIEWRTLKK